MEAILVQAVVTIVTTVCGYGAVRGKLNQLLREVGELKRDRATDKQQISDMREEVRILKTIAHSH